MAHHQPCNAGPNQSQFDQMSKASKQAAIESINFTGDPRQFTYGEVVTESLVIMRLLEQTFPGGEYGPYSRARDLR